jgi:hypothetical protein
MHTPPQRNFVAERPAAAQAFAKANAFLILNIQITIDIYCNLQYTYKA